MLQTALAYVDTHRDRFLNELVELLRIPSISTLPDHQTDILDAAGWLAEELERVGLKHVQVMASGGNPMVYGQCLGAGDGAPTVLVYGHYDVQPIDPLDLWQTPPFEPTIRDGRIYARGASDNKAQFFSHIKAIESLLEAGDLPFNVKFLLEGEEEIGSPNIEAFIAENRDLLAADSGIISDGGMIRPAQPSIDYGLRGVVYMEINLKGPKSDLHSGRYGGSVHNPAQVIGEIIAALHDEDGTIRIPGFYDKVRPVTSQEREIVARSSYSFEDWHRETGAPAAWGESDYTLLERIGARPACDVNGLWGGYQDVGAKTIIPSVAGAKISMRIVPDQEPEEIARLFTEYIQSITPDHVQIDIQTLVTCSPALMPLDSLEVAAASQAIQSIWGKEPIFLRGGGSLPVVAAFQKGLDAPMLLMPFGLEDNRHAPNEHYHLDYFYRGIQTAIHYYLNLAQSYQE